MLVNPSQPTLVWVGVQPRVWDSPIPVSVLLFLPLWSTFILLSIGFLPLPQLG